MDISVIIPVYKNSKSDIERCLDSLKNQTFTGSMEVIMVDDGNEPAYASRLDTFLQYYPFLHIYHRPHSGVSAARNFGTEVAAGDFITYVDADDYVSPYFLEEGIQDLKNRDADIVYGRVLFTESDKKVKFERIKDSKLLNRHDKKMLYYYMFDLVPEPSAEVEFKDNYGYINRGPAGKLIRIELARAVKFPTELDLGEDNIWNFRILSIAEKLLVSSAQWYAYLNNSESATHKFNPNQAARMQTFLRSLKLYVTDKYSQGHYFNRVISELKVLIMICYANPSNQQKNFFRNKESFDKVVKSIPLIDQYRFADVSNFGFKAIVKWILLKLNLLYIIFYLKAK